MYTLLYIVYEKLQEMVEKNKKAKLRGGICQRICSLIYYYMNKVHVNYLKIHKSKATVNKVKRSEEYIVSLTSFPARIGTVWLTVESLLRQKTKADKIILWLADSQFPKGYAELPKRLIDMQERGLEIKFCEDLKSYKKFYYTMQLYKQSNIITADDDCLYPTDYISSLMEMHQQYPKDVVCRTAPLITPNYLTSPSKWNGLLSGEVISSYRLSINSGSGALFPPGSLGEEAFNKEAFLKLCPFADDLWLTVMVHLNGTQITRTKYHPYPIVISGTQKVSLVSINRGDSPDELNNDKQWSNLIRKYQSELKSIIEAQVEE